jgi:Cation transport ATPase
LDDSKIDYLSLRESNPVIAQLPFSTERKYMATLIRSDYFGRPVLYLKGAPEVIMNFCSQVTDGTSLHPILQKRASVEDRLLGYQRQGMRTLAFAYKCIDDLTDVEMESFFSSGKLELQNMVFMGIVAIADPVREDVAEAIGETQHAGIQVKIVTGRHFGNSTRDWSTDRLVAGR